MLHSCCFSYCKELTNTKNSKNYKKNWNWRVRWCSALVKVQALLDSNWPFKPRYALVQVIHILVSINSLNNWLGAFDKWSKHITLGDHLNNSHNLFSWLSIDIINVRWKLMLLRVNKYYKKITNNIYQWDNNFLLNT